MPERVVGITLDDLLAMQRDAAATDVHVVAFDAGGFHLAHTDAECAVGENTPACRFHQWLAEIDAAPSDQHGVYVMVEHIPDAYSEPYGALPFELFPWKEWCR